MSEQLSLRRLGLLLRNDFLRGHRSLSIVIATITLLILVGPLGPFGDRALGIGFYRNLFLGALFGLGTLMTSVAFNDMHGRTTNTAFLLLPATALEKTVARLIASTVFLIPFLLVFTSVLSLLVEGLELVGLVRSNEWFSPLDGTVWSVIPYYLPVQALFFLGSAWFRRFQFVKTLLALAVLDLGLFVFVLALAWLFGAATWSGTGLTVDGDFQGSVYMPMQWLLDAIVVAYFTALPLFCWFVAWLRVKETQVSHGV